MNDINKAIKIPVAKIMTLPKTPKSLPSAAPKKSPMFPANSY